MAVSVKVDPIDRDVRLLIDDLLAPEAQAKQLADFAVATRDATQQLDEQVLGHPITYLDWVDGNEGADEQSVRPGGTIVYEFPLLIEVLKYIGTALEQNSPIGGGSDAHPGQYEHSHRLFVDGMQVPIDDKISTDAHEYLFVSTLPYSRKIDQGESVQAPAGVHEVVANEARKRYGNIAVIQFDEWVGVYGVTSQSRHAKHNSQTRKAHNVSGNRFPAIRVTVK